MTLEKALERLRNADRDVRALGAMALGEFRDPRTFPVLMKGLEDADPGVRGHCATALGLLGDRRAIPTLEALAERLAKNLDRLVEQAGVEQSRGRIVIQMLEPTHVREALQRLKGLKP